MLGKKIPLLSAPSGSLFRHLSTLDPINLEMIELSVKSGEASKHYQT